MASDSSGSNSVTTELRSLISHSVAVAAEMTVEGVQAEFGRLNVDFVGVLEGEKLLGVCARRELTQALGSRFGFSLYARQPVRARLMASPMVVHTNTDLTEVFKVAAARLDREFYDDVLLLDEQSHYVGMIPMRTLVRLQTEFLLGNIVSLEASRQEIAARNRQMEEDLTMAKEVQLAMLPGKFNADGRTSPTVKIAHRFRPAHGVSGDFFNILPLGPQTVGVLVCDVMGHGVRSALITAMIRAFVQELKPVSHDPALFLTRLNHDLTALLRQTGSLIFVTAAYVVIDAARQQLRYAQAGHPPPLHTGHAANTTTAISFPEELAGPALGLIEDYEYAAIEYPFIMGDRLLLFTDGVTEAASTSGTGEEFGTDRLAQLLTGTKSEQLEISLDQLLAEVIRFAGETLPDDFCAIAIELA